VLIPAQRILASLNTEIARLPVGQGDAETDGSATMSITNALRLLSRREAGGSGAIHRRFEALEALLEDLSPATAGGGCEFGTHLAGLRDKLGSARRDAQDSLARLEQAWRAAMAELQACVTVLNRASGVDELAKAGLRSALAAWESDYLISAAAVEDESAEEEAVEITRERLADYLRQRFDEPDLQVEKFQPLAGGFGKQTILFDVAGKALAGSFVMRRDMGLRPSVANDCHRVRDEFAVIRAARDRGFPAPEALWLDTEHCLLRGGDFIVMRRSPGKLPGNFFGSRVAIPAGLNDALATIMAQLHTLEPLSELGELTESICAARWRMSRGEATASYIRAWYELFLASDHTPSPALAAIYGWLLDNVPDRPGKPSLLHGDIGFHNFLFDDDKLSAVLDWEFAHVGDPAEELGYVAVTLGGSVDWARLMARYIEAGGEAVDAQTLRYFKVWAFARNATGANLLSTLFCNGHAPDLKLAILPVAHIPQFLRGAQALIEEKLP